MTTSYSKLTENLFVHHGVINVGILRAKGRALLIDFGNGDVQATLDALKISRIDFILFTHHHRDQASGILDNVGNVGNVGNSFHIGVPLQERAYFEDVERFWNNPKMRWHLYNYHPHNLMLTESIPVTDVYKDGDIIEWRNTRISVIETPGHTDGSVSYIVEVDEKRFGFCGDAIYDEGQIWELYSLQKSGETSTDYHGFLGARNQLKHSLMKLRSVALTALIPSHGNIMYQPEKAIDALLERLELCYDKYVAISALRHYFPKMFAEFEGRAGHMPSRKGKEVPDFLRHYGTSWLIISQNKEAFLMDCGSLNVIKWVQQLKEQGEISEVTEFWVTHYHDDHVDAIPQLQQMVSCPTKADAVVAEVIENPRAYRLPCISPSIARIDHHTKNGESWTWNEFKMTAYHFPGQTYYHGGLLVEGRGVRLFFSGDSFTMSGIDDYCSWNRNWLGEGLGYDLCLQLIQNLKPTHVFNCHVNPAFDFTDEEIKFMRQNLTERERLYSQLFPWDAANYGMDEHWVRCYPYEQDASPGDAVTLRLDITNHSSKAKPATCRPIPPASWGIKVDEQSATIPPKSDGHLHFSFTIPKHAESKRAVIPVEVTYDGHRLGQFREAILVIGRKGL